MKWLLWPLSWFYRALTGVRRFAFQSGIRAVSNMSVPVIVVGNISVGGTGKTPCVIWLAAELQNRGYTVGVVSRGYGGLSKDWPQWVTPDSDPKLVGDESVLVAMRARCPVMVGPDRVAAAKGLLAEAPVDVLISDDGLQHYRLGRDFEIAIVDGVRGLGNGFCLPAGPLREPASRLNEVGAVIVNGGDWDYSGVFRAEVVPQRAYQVRGTKEVSLEEFRKRVVHAVAGVGHPQRFFKLLEEAELRVLPHPLPDHVKLEPTHLSFDDSAPVMITEKDGVKCRYFAHSGVWCVPLEFRLVKEDVERFMYCLLQKL
ncbi:MAG: tetraacyldisaccharide 4'-kinase [Gammaproteobacteria bacterium]